MDPEILRSFEKLGIPEHERKYLAGIETMNDSETIYANVKKNLLISELFSATLTLPSKNIRNSFVSIWEP